ncbi:MAG: hypothetical protein P1P76_05135 [Anaerolineales bacterium]|nr:hypothetical protein [Anaerolineales bacterium]
MKRFWPALVVLIVSGSYVAWRLASYDGNPVALAEIGTRYAELDPDGTEGYDGQFSTYIALDPEPESVAAHLDVPAYRYQRILYPLLARLLAFGQPDWIPWSLILVNLLAHSAATYAVADILARRGLATGYALIYGLWVGLVSSVGLNLNEPLAYGLVVLAFLFKERGRFVPLAIALSLAMFAKETSAVFWLAILISDLVGRKIDRGQAALFGAGGLFVLWQVWLWRTFGTPGIGSGGEMATPFEWIPFMGFLRIGGVSIKALGLFALIFGPTIILPTVYALIQGVARLRVAPADSFAWSEFLNAAVIVLLPFSTFREPLGLVRIFTGVVLSLLLLNVSLNNRRTLNFALFWIAMLALLINQ